MLLRALPLAFVIHLLLGCSSEPPPPDYSPIYEAVLNHEFKDPNAMIYLSLNGEDPKPKELEILRKRVPNVEALTKAPDGIAIRVGLNKLKLSPGKAEISRVISNDKEWKMERVWLVQVEGGWGVEKVEGDYEQ